MNGPNLRKVFSIILIVLIAAVIYLILPAGKAATAAEGSALAASTPTLAVNPLKQLQLYAFVEAPAGEVDQPYLALSAYGNMTAGTAIKLRGVINDNLEFTCGASPCKLPLTSDSIVKLWAYTDQGEQSQTLTATARISKTASGKYQVTLSYNNPVLQYHDSCASIWNVYPAALPQWAQMPNSPALLNTNQKLYYLAASLIRMGVVDASSCANGGLDSRYSPNGCGMEKAAPALTEWQNKFDLDIWLTGGSVGLPPKLLKTLMARESQFWPGSTRYFLNEYGLAQINDFGADVALRWDPSLYQDACTGILADCSTPYRSDSSQVQAMMRGALISQLNADCPTCKYGINLDIAHSSVYVIARVVHANCWETRFSLSNNKAAAKTYEDLWKLTMLSYHSGFYCLDAAVKSAVNADLDITWENIADKIPCSGGRQYVEDFWAALNGFDNQVIPLPALTSATLNTLPTPTAGPTPTQVVSQVRLRVRVYNDTNNDGMYQSTEGVNGVAVKITLSDNTVQTGTTDAQGMSIFDLSGRPVGEVVIVQLPDLFRRENIILPQSGVVDVVFKFNQPVLPTSTP